MTPIGVQLSWKSFLRNEFLFFEISERIWLYYTTLKDTYISRKSRKTDFTTTSGQKINFC